MCRGCALISRNIPHPELGSVWLFICLFLVFRRNICTFDPTEKPTVTDNEDREREYSEVRLTTYFWFHRTSTSSWTNKTPAVSLCKIQRDVIEKKTPRVLGAGINLQRQYALAAVCTSFIAHYRFASSLHCSYISTCRRWHIGNATIYFEVHFNLRQCR